MAPLRSLGKVRATQIQMQVFEDKADAGLSRAEFDQYQYQYV